MSANFCLNITRLSIATFLFNNRSLEVGLYCLDLRFSSTTSTPQVARNYITNSYNGLILSSNLRCVLHPDKSQLDHLPATERIEYAQRGKRHKY